MFSTGPGIASLHCLNCAVYFVEDWGNNGLLFCQAVCKIWSHRLSRRDNVPSPGNDQRPVYRVFMFKMFMLPNLFSFVFVSTASINLSNSSLIPASLNWDAMVPITGSSSSFVLHKPWLRLYCLRTSASASNAPAFIEFIDGDHPHSPAYWFFPVEKPLHIPVSSHIGSYRNDQVLKRRLPHAGRFRIIKSYPASLHISIASCTCSLKGAVAFACCWERIYARGWWMEFMRIRSPNNKAPPVFFFGRINRDYRNCFVRKIVKEPAHDLICYWRFSPHRLCLWFPKQALQLLSALLLFFTNAILRIGNFSGYLPHIFPFAQSHRYVIYTVAVLKNNHMILLRLRSSLPIPFSDHHPDYRFS